MSLIARLETKGDLHKYVNLVSEFSVVSNFERLDLNTHGRTYDLTLKVNFKYPYFL